MSAAVIFPLDGCRQRRRHPSARWLLPTPPSSFRQMAVANAAVIFPPDGCRQCCHFSAARKLPPTSSSSFRIIFLPASSFRRISLVEERFSDCLETVLACSGDLPDSIGTGSPKILFDFIFDVVLARDGEGPSSACSRLLHFVKIADAAVFSFRDVIARWLPAPPSSFRQMAAANVVTFLPRENCPQRRHFSTSRKLPST